MASRCPSSVVSNVALVSSSPDKHSSSICVIDLIDAAFCRQPTNNVAFLHVSHFSRNSSHSQGRSLQEDYHEGAAARLPTYRFGITVQYDTCSCSPSRFIDTAVVYENEATIGEVISDTTLARELKLERKDLFITTKLGPADQSHEKCRDSVLQSLDRLRVDYIDLLLIHWPGASGLEPQDPQNAVLRKESWQELERLVGESKLKSIGVSNYCMRHMDELMAYCSVKPVVNQVEFHPHCYQRALLEHSKAMDVQLQAYSSLGSANGWDELRSDESLVALAARKRRTIAQILLKWALNHGVLVIPKTANEKNLATNLDLFSFDLSPKEMSAIDALNRDHHYSWDPEEVR